MLTATLESIDVASGPALDEIMKRTYAALAAGAITDTEAEEIESRVHLRRASRAAARGGRLPAPAAQLSMFPPKRRPRSPDRAASRERRRSLSGSGHLPPNLRAMFTPGEAAVLFVIKTEVQRTGCCELCVDAIAAQAGVCARMVQTTVRAAKRAAAIHVEERRRPGAKSLTNRITIISAEWLQWLARGPRDRAKNAPHHVESKKILPPYPLPEAPSRSGFRGYRRPENAMNGTAPRDSRRLG